MTNESLKFKSHQQYHLKNGPQVLGVTTVLAQLGKPQLLMWVYRLTSKGIKYWEVTEKSKNVGTIAHYLIQCFLSKTHVDRFCIDDFSRNEINLAYVSFNKFKKWFEDHNVRVLYTELEMISEKYEYGGTVDFIAYVDKKLCLIDVKTGSGIYHEMKYQLSAYRQLYEETMHKKIQRSLILHLPHEKTEGFTEHEISLIELDTAFSGFMLLLQFYEINRKMQE